MPVTFILGRAGSGKTRHCVDALLAELERPNEIRRLILLVPEQASFQMERTLATRATRGGYSRAAVLSFSRLTHQALAELGDAPDVVSSAARVMALRAVATRMGKALRYYRQAAQTAGFFMQLERLIEELLSENVPPESLGRAARQFEPPAARRKVAELSALYAGYLDWLGRERIDPAARLSLLRERLLQLVWLRDSSFWVDGFAGFTGQEVTTLVELARTVRDLTITLLVDPHSPAIRADSAPAALHLFRRTEITYQKLRALVEAASVPCTDPLILHPAPPPRFARAPALAQLEAGLAAPLTAPEAVRSQRDASPPEAVALLECVTHRDELQQAARAIRQKIIESAGALRLRDFAVIARELEPLAPIVADVFSEYEIPYFLDRRRPMRSHPLSRFVEALFQAIGEDFSVAATTRLLRTGLLPIERDQAEALENVIVAHTIHGLTAWRQPQWTFSDDVPSLTRRESQAPPPSHLPPFPLSHAPRVDDLDAARLQLVTVIEPLLALATQDPPPTADLWVCTITEILEALSVRRRLESWIATHRQNRRWEQAETNRIAWEALCGVLDDLHTVLGEERLRADEVAGMLSATLRDQTLGLAPPTLDQVLVSSIERSRHPEIKHAWLCAFNEGIFPARPADDELLDADERDTLTRAGLAAPASHREDSFGERLLAYIAFTRPSVSLTISYASVAEDGQPLLPSPLLADVRRVLPELQITRPQPDPPPVSLPELARGYLHTRALPSLEPAAARYMQLVETLRHQPATASQLNRLLRGLEYRNSAESIAQCRPSRPDGLAWRGSPSEAETYLDCAFKHFAQYALRVDAMRGPRPLAWDLGSLAHEMLAEITRRATAQPGGVHAVQNERWAELVREVVDEFRGRLPPDLPQRRPDMAFLSEFLYDFVGELIAVHASRWHRGHFEPKLLETPFGAEPATDGLPGLDLTLTDGRRVRLRGKIDRVDLCQQGGQTLVLVYDYKSSIGPLGGSYLTGGALQILSYLLATRSAMPDGDPVTLAGVFLAPLYPDEEVLGTQYAQSAAADQQAMYLYRPRGLFTETAARLLDPQLAQTASPVARMRLKKDGSFDRAQSRDVVNEGGLEARLALARQTLLMAAEGIVAGKVEPAPLVEGHTLACRRCDFQSLCRFDPLINQPRLAERVLPTLDQFAAKAQAEGGDE
jgi:ATP-dependent helicase/nuclease subunit B